MKKMIVSTPSAIAGMRMSRCSVKASIASDVYPRATRDGEHDRPQLDPLQSLAYGGGVLVDVQPDVGRVVPDDLLRLAHDRRLLRRVGRGVRLREQLIDLRVAVAAEVPHRRPAGLVGGGIGQRPEG